VVVEPSDDLTEDDLTEDEGGGEAVGGALGSANSESLGRAEKAKVSKGVAVVAEHCSKSMHLYACCAAVASNLLRNCRCSVRVAKPLQIDVAGRIESIAQLLQNIALDTERNSI